ncbi:MAG TPA: hypothetical protein VJW23_17840, partial [Propionibacteriaceae bacterium]|nr:hypothetical protein [Propionibacteriaceae bacterium]
VVQHADELPETIAFAVVDLDVRAIVRHHFVLPTVETLNREVHSNDAESAGARDKSWRLDTAPSRPANRVPNPKTSIEGEHPRAP